MLLLKETTPERLFEEIDNHLDDLKRKPRKEYVTALSRVPGGCLLEPVESGKKMFIAFFPEAGSLEVLKAVMPDTLKSAVLEVETVVDNVTTVTSTSLGKGLNNLEKSIPVAANTKVSLTITSSEEINSAVFGYVFVPSGR